MNHRRRRRIRILREDIAIMALLLSAMIGAWLCWPEKLVADIAAPTALMIAFISWRWL
jgi:hypothetical protein